MSWHDCSDAECRIHEAEIDPIETVIVPRSRDLGGFEVRRALPSREKRLVGPFIFFDQMGPSEFILGKGIDVRPHPHIGLSTITYLYRGQIMHRDSLGTQLPIKPGEVNWMTAGKGIAHSERTPEEDRKTGAELFGIQAWVALPKAHEETEPDFVHHDQGDLPILGDTGVEARLIAGTYAGKRSPVRTSSDLFYVDVVLQTGGAVPLDAEFEERAIYVSEGQITVAESTHQAGELVVLKPGAAVRIQALAPSRIMLLGGEPMDGPRYIWWNFVSSRQDRIEAAKADWKAGKFDPVPDDFEFIPLPDN